MANPRVGGENKDDKKAEDKLQQLHSLVDRVRYESKPPNDHPTPLTNLGYLAKAGPKVEQSGMKLRADVIAAQQELTKFAESKEVKSIGDAKDSENVKLHIDRVFKAYNELHQAQGKYVDALLAGEKPNLGSFKTQQQEKIDACKAALAELATDAKAVSAVTAVVKSQTDKLDKLPSQIQPTQEWLEKELKHHKSRALEKKRAIEIGKKPEGRIFTTYWDRDKDAEKKYDFKIPDAPGVGGVNRPDRKYDEKVYENYETAREKILNKIKAIEADKTLSETTWFMPIDKEEKDLDYVLKLRKDEASKQWGMEIHMLKGKWLDPKNFAAAVKDIIAFQEFSGLELEDITLSYSEPTLGKYSRDDRIKQIEAMLTILEKRDPIDKALNLDSHSLHTIAQCDAGKREKIKERLDALRATVNDRRKKMADEAAKMGVDKTELQNSIKAEHEKLEKKAAQKTDLSKAMNTAASVPVGGDEIPLTVTALRELVGENVEDEQGAGLAADAPILDNSAKKDKILRGLKEEEKQVDDILTALQETQSELRVLLDKIGKALPNDPDDPSFDPDLPDLYKKYKALEDFEKNTREALKARCEKWSGEKGHEKDMLYAKADALDKRLNEVSKDVGIAQQTIEETEEIFKKQLKEFESAEAKGDPNAATLIAQAKEVYKQEMEKQRKVERDLLSTRYNLANETAQWFPPYISVAEYGNFEQAMRARRDLLSNMERDMQKIHDSSKKMSDKISEKQAAREESMMRLGRGA